MRHVPRSGRIEDAHSLAIDYVIQGDTLDCAIAKTRRKKRLTITRSTLSRKVRSIKHGDVKTKKPSAFTIEI